jgi:site-specific recombinase XerD
MSTYTKKKIRTVPFSNIIGEYLSDLRVHNLSPTTIRVYKYNLERLVKFLKLGQVADVELQFGMVTNERARGYLEMRLGKTTLYEDHPLRPVQNKKLSSHTVHQEVRALRSFGSWLAENGYDNPFKDLPRPKLTKYAIDILTDAEINTLYSVYNPDTGYGARWQALISFFLGTGVRLNELVTLDLSNLDLEHRRAKVMGKGSKERFVRFGDRAHKYISRYINLFRPKTDDTRVFVGLDGICLTDKGVQNIVRNVRIKTGINRLHAHLFRHTYATRFLLAGGGEFDLQMLLGHESLEMTRRYVHLAKQLAGPNSLDDRRPDPLDEIELDIDRRGGRRSRRVPTRRPSSEHRDSSQLPGG